jgi:ribosomal protein S18 acetylase RimI-like enzyme
MLLATLDNIGTFYSNSSDIIFTLMIVMKNNTKLQIRHYKVSDYSSVIAIYKESDLFEAEWDTEELITAKIERDPGSILVALINNHIVGTVYILEDGRFGFVFRLAVTAAEQGTGIGTKLLTEAERILKKRGIKIVNIIVNEKHENLQKYYEKLNYNKGRVWRWMWKELK